MSTRPPPPSPTQGGARGTASHPALAGLVVLERGWLSSNNILIHAAPGEPGGVLIDTGHVAHRAQTLALVQHALDAAPHLPRLARIVNTHLHSDHCGGNAALQQAHGVPIVIPPGLADAVRAWDLRRLSHDDFGQRERFHIEGTLAPGESFIAGGRRWQALAAPGHDPHSLVLFEAEAGLLLSADALWENGFGVVFPELVGESGFAEVGQTLDLIESLPVRLVVPGHGAPFADVAGALARARARLAAQRADPARHARHAAKVLLKYHLMELRRLPRAELVRWAAAAPLMRQVWTRFGAQWSAGGAAPTRATARASTPPTPATAALPSGIEAGIEVFLRELAGSGAIALAGDDVVDC